MKYRTDAELENALESLATDPGLRQRFSKAGLEAFQANWTADRHIARYLELIAELQATRHHSPTHLDS